MLMTEFDLLSQDIQKQITNKTQSNFARATTDNMTRVLQLLAKASNYDKVQIAQMEVGIQLNLSQNRVSELLNLAKKIGLIGINMICRCGDVRNEYTLLDSPIMNTIKRIAFKSSKADTGESIDLALAHTMAFYRREGEQEHILEEVKRRIPISEFIKATGIFAYFRKTLKTVKRELADFVVETTTHIKNSKKSGFNNYEQRPFDPSLEEQLLGINVIKEPEETFDMYTVLNEIRK